MSEPVRSQMIQAYNWIKEGNNAQAEELLIKILQEDETNADAWWLLANALQEPVERLEALDQLLELRPGDEKALKLRARLQGGSNTPARFSAPAAPPPAPPAFSMPVAPPPPAPSKAPPAAPAKAPPAEAPKAPSSAQKAPVKTDEEAPFIGLRDTATFRDPFADVKSTDADPFAEVHDEDDPFAVAEAVQKNRPPKRRSAPPTPAKSNSSVPKWAVPAAAIVLVVLVCIAVYIVGTTLLTRTLTGVGETLASTLAADPTMQAVLNDPTLQAAFSQAGAEGLNFSFAERTLPAGLNSRDGIIVGQTVRGTLNDSRDAWSINLNGGTQVTVRVNAISADLDVRVAIYGPDNQLISANDDIDLSSNNFNAEAPIRASQSGIYTIVVDEFGFDGGEYELVVR